MNTFFSSPYFSLFLMFILSAWIEAYKTQKEMEAKGFHLPSKSPLHPVSLIFLPELVNRVSKGNEFLTFALVFIAIEIIALIKSVLFRERTKLLSDASELEVNLKRELVRWLRRSGKVTSAKCMVSNHGSVYLEFQTKERLKEGEIEELVAIAGDCQYLQVKIAENASRDSSFPPESQIFSKERR